MEFINTENVYEDLIKLNLDYIPIVFQTIEIGKLNLNVSKIVLLDFLNKVPNGFSLVHLLNVPEKNLRFSWTAKERHWTYRYSEYPTKV